MKITNALKATLRRMLNLQLGEVSVDDGKKLYWSTDEDLKQGDEVFVEDEDGTLVPASDGEYTTEDGKSITVENGIVTEIKDKEAEVAPQEEAKEEAKEETPVAQETVEEIPNAEPADNTVTDEVSVEERVAAVENKVADILNALEKVLNAMSAMEGRVEAIEEKIAKLDGEPVADPVADEPVEQTKMSRMDILKGLVK